MALQSENTHFRKRRVELHAYIAYIAYNAGMAILSIRNLPDEVHAALRIKAAQAGSSMEAEARRILADACLENKQPASAKKLQTLVQTLYGKQKPVNVTDELIRQRRTEAKNE